MRDHTRAKALGDLNLEQHLSSAEVKQRFVTEMFDVIAPRYDKFTRVFSFGMDARWKRYILRAIEKAELPEGGVVDLACGTGDIAFALAQIFPVRTVAGLDVSSEMLAIAQRRLPGETAASPGLTLGDMMRPPLRPGSIALATAGYAFRNVPDFREALRQLSAVMPRGALLVTLDFYLPSNRLWRALYLLWLRVAGKVVGWLWHRSPVVYEYIAHSIRHFVTAGEFSAELRRAGFDVDEEKRWLWGGVVAHFSRRV